jgi:hypothetical protein
MIARGAVTLVVASLLTLAAAQTRTVTIKSTASLDGKWHGVGMLGVAARS